MLLDELLVASNCEIVPISHAELAAAYAAFVLYGKGSGHPAALNCGAVLAYAVAKVRRIPLLYKGQGFATTDIEGV